MRTQMQLSVHLLLFVIAVVFFILAGLGVPEAPRLRYIGWGLALWAISLTISF